MKKIMMLMWVMVIGMGSMMAQSPHFDKNKIDEIKEAFFIEHLKLSKSEAEKFWKVYQQYDAERHSLRKAAKKPVGKSKFSEMSEKEIYDFIDYNLEMREKELQLQKKYFVEFKKLLPAQKVVRLLNIEEQFRQYLFKQAKEKK